MNPTGKKFIALFLVFSLMMLSVNLHAKERRGAKIIVTKKGGQQIEGELITVKPNSLLLLNTEGKDVSVDTEDIEAIRILKKSKTLIGAGLGVLATGVIGIGYTLLIAEGEDWKIAGWIGTVIGVIGGALIGALIGTAAGKDKTFQIEGMSDSEIQEAMDKLRKKARVREYK